MRKLLKLFLHIISAGIIFILSNCITLAGLVGSRGIMTIGALVLVPLYVGINIVPSVFNQQLKTGKLRNSANGCKLLRLFLLSTATMIKMGKVYSNQMVDLRATNDKLRNRAVRIFCTITKADESVAGEYLQLAENDTKLAILMYASGMDRKMAMQFLAQHAGDSIREYTGGTIYS
uniref:hypothetical protein n=1 Tax=Acetatifactor sp. TaxID=1872090 RepID=UPI004055AA38